MNGCSRMTSISERASRAYSAQATSGTPISTPLTPGPTMAITAIDRAP